MKDLITTEFNEHIKAVNLLHNLTEDVYEAAHLCIECLKNDGKILIFGNGGSASDAQHFAAELVGKYKINRKGLSAIALTTDSSSITSIGNDFGYDRIFDRQVQALSKPGDVAIGISTSGNSINVLNALKLAANLNCKTIGLSGQDSLNMSKICNINISAPSQDTPRIQEIHIIIAHTICHIIDLEFQN